MKQIIIIFILFILQLKNINAVGKYIPPRKDIFLISCMDLRLLDDIVIFMKEDNLTNRYDHFILAGASLGAHNDNPYGPEWKKTLFQHFEIAKNLHRIEDIYIIEHRDCGAYKSFLSSNGTFGDSDNDQRKEYKAHKHYSDVLSKEFLKKYSTPSHPLKIKTFIMDLRGNVDLLNKY
ncbi:hypothetical protein BJ944DRAFT_244673 [Cunninghamella echinulata]|nr:hypothetical protein BJ944DRAFT_244673 [Cunninghamella echinulata]